MTLPEMRKLERERNALYQRIKNLMLKHGAPESPTGLFSSTEALLVTRVSGDMCETICMGNPDLAYKAVEQYVHKEYPRSATLSVEKIKKRHRTEQARKEDPFNINKR